MTSKEVRVRGPPFSLPLFAKHSRPAGSATRYASEMRSYVRPSHPRRSVKPAHRHSVRQAAVRADRPLLPPTGLTNDLSVEPAHTVAANPYLDYGRFLTPEGGVLIVYKDLDLRLRHTLWRVLAWSVATGCAGWFLRQDSPVHATWINVLGLMSMGLLNWLVVAKPIEIYRRIEVRPDCLILEGVEIFWRERMEGGLPTLQPEEDGSYILCGVYGTRFVEYGTLRRFDEFDRMPETLAAHLAAAMGQLWEIDPSKS